MSARAPFLLTTAIASVVLLSGCPSTVATPAATGATAGAKDVISFGGNPDCCERSERTYAADEPTPFGASVQTRLLELGDLQCRMQRNDGTAMSVRVVVGEVGTVAVSEGRPREESCPQCFSELRFDARVDVQSADGFTWHGRTTLRELEPGDGFVFSVVQDELFLSGTLQAEAPSLRLFRWDGDATIGDPIAEALAPCERLTP